MALCAFSYSHHTHGWWGILSESAEEGGESTTFRLESQQEPAADTCLDRQTFSSSVTQILHIKLVYMNKVATTNMHFQSFSIHLFSVEKALQGRV